MTRNSEGSIPRLRIETLSDLVFGLALSIGALALISKPPTTPADIQADVFNFGFSFLILISVWLRYTRIMSVLPAENGFILFLNVVLLFLVSVEPYLLSLLSQSGALLDYTSTLYALDMFGLMMILALLTHMLTKEEGALIPARLISKEKTTRNAFGLSAFLFLISTLPQFWLFSINGFPVRILLWLPVLAVTWSVRIYLRNK